MFTNRYILNRIKQTRYPIYRYFSNTILEERVRECITNKLLATPPKPISKNSSNDIILNDIYYRNSDSYNHFHQMKLLQMSVGNIWQDIFGTVDGIQNLGVGHSTGLDLLSEDNKFCIELKNRHNTDNSSSRKQNYKKLADFKVENPEYDCIYGVINCHTPDNIGKHYSFEENDQDLTYLSGDKLLTFLLGEDKNNIIEIFRRILEEKYIKI